jgi:hypothetical protein
MNLRRQNRERLLNILKNVSKFSFQEHLHFFAVESPLKLLQSLYSTVCIPLFSFVPFFDMVINITVFHQHFSSVVNKYLFKTA